MKILKMLTTSALVAGALPLTADPADAQTPEAAGSYELVQVNGQALPVVIERTENCQEEVLSGTLVLEADGDWEFEHVERETCGTDVDEDTEREDGDYVVSGEALTFSDDTDEFDPDDLDIDEFGTGTITSEGVRVTLQDGRTELLFRRR